MKTIFIELTEKEIEIIDDAIEDAGGYANEMYDRIKKESYKKLSKQYWEFLDVFRAKIKNGLKKVKCEKCNGYGEIKGHGAFGETEYSTCCWCRGKGYYYARKG